MRAQIAVAVLPALFVAALAPAGSPALAGTGVCPENPSPPNAVDPSMILDVPAEGAAITSPVPTLKPARTGREMKSPRNPNLKNPAASRMHPVTTARVAVAVA